MSSRLSSTAGSTGINSPEERDPELRGSIVHPYLGRFHYKKPLAPISRTMDGKFILDKDSEDGGFTSSRRPIRCLVRKHSYFSPYARPNMDSHTYIWMDGHQEVDRKSEQWRHPEAAVESGVYHVRTGRASRLADTQSGPRVLSAQSSRMLPKDETVISPVQPQLWSPVYYSPVSPEFGRHVIPDSPGERTRPGISRRFRSSSPGPFSNEWSQLAHLAAFSELSSVRLPSSVERSFPSTLLTSLQSSTQRTPSVHEASISALQQRGIEQQQMLRRHPASQRELPMLTPITSAHFGPRIHLVGAQVHSPPHTHTHAHPLVHQPSGTIYYPDQLRTWQTPVSSAFIQSYRPIHPTTGRTLDRTHMHYRDSRTHTFSPPYRDSVIPRPLISPRHYVNLPPRRADFYQRIPEQEPYYLLKPSSSENQKSLAPLATSSPPRLRPYLKRLRPSYDVGLSPHLRPPSSEPSGKIPRLHVTRVPDVQPKENLKMEYPRHGLGSSESSSEKPITYTRDRLQEAIGRVRSGLFRSTDRPHSAPNLSSPSSSEMLPPTHPPFITSKHLLKKTRPVVSSRETSHEQSQEMSHEQSPDSSSGFGSKNTSHQQSSSQSGHSASALGLDSASRLESSEQEEISSQWIRAASKPYSTTWISRRQPPSYNEWLSNQLRAPVPVLGKRPTLLITKAPSSETNILKQEPSFEPVGSPSQPPDDSISESLPPESFAPDRSFEFPYLRKIPPDESLDVTEPLSINTTHRLSDSLLTTAAPFNQAPALDISVDDHYEFDTVLSPTPGDDNVAMWSRARIPSGERERGLSDSEIYESSAGSGSRRRRSQESTEARVAAMKQEFHEYRQRQAKRRRSRELESVC